MRPLALGLILLFQSLVIVAFIAVYSPVCDVGLGLLAAVPTTGKFWYVSMTEPDTLLIYFLMLLRDSGPPLKGENYVLEKLLFDTWCWS